MREEPSARGGIVTVQGESRESGEVCYAGRRRQKEGALGNFLSFCTGESCNMKDQSACLSGVHQQEEKRGENRYS